MKGSHLVPSHGDAGTSFRSRRAQLMNALLLVSVQFNFDRKGSRTSGSGAVMTTWTCQRTLNKTQHKAPDPKPEDKESLNLKFVR